MGHWIETKYIYNWCLLLGILPITWMNNGNGTKLLGRQEWGWTPSPLCSYHSRCQNKLNQHQGCSILAVSCLKWSAIFLGKKTKTFFFQHLHVISGVHISFSHSCYVWGLLCIWLSVVLYKKCCMWSFFFLFKTTSIKVGKLGIFFLGMCHIWIC